MNSLCKTNTRNNSIDLFRYVCAIMVVIIHSTFYTGWGAFGLFIGHIFPRIAVPFFFATSGYFYIKKLIEGKPVFLKQLKHILLTYSIWSSVYFALDFFNCIILDRAPILPFLKKCVVAFFIEGSAGHFWYFPALIIALCIVTLFYKLKAMKLLIPVSAAMYVLGCLGCSYYELSRKIPFLGSFYEMGCFNTIRRIFLMAFPLFSTGYLLIKLEKKYVISNKKLIISWIITATAFLAEVLTVVCFEIQENFVLTFSLYFMLIATMFLLLSNPLAKYQKFAKPARTIANFTYYSHPLFQIFAKLFSKFTNIAIPNIIVFFCTIAITFILGYICYILIEKKDIRFVKLMIG